MFSIEDLFSKCDQIRSIIRIWLHLLKKSLMENFIFCVVFTLNAINQCWQNSRLRENCPYSELFWSRFFRIRTKYGEMWGIQNLSILSLKAQKWATEYLGIQTLFTQYRFKYDFFLLLNAFLYLKWIQNFKVVCGKIFCSFWLQRIKGIKNTVF